MYSCFPYWGSQRKLRRGTTAEIIPPLIFGEVLFDLFEPGQAVLGGAPFNVAWHLQGFGLKPFFVSRIGKDEMGERIIQQMKEWGMATTGVQWDEHHATGVVRVSSQDGEPGFDIRPHQAYDYIRYSQSIRSVQPAAVSMIYHGTLALRNEVSRKTLKRIRGQIPKGIFVDVNLRSPWWNDELVLEQVAEARWIKCNVDELLAIAAANRLKGGDIVNLAETLCNKFNLAFLVVTMGADGAFIVGKEGELEKSLPVPAADMVDTVGAGDAFSAVTIIGILRQWTLPTILERALEFASKICQVKGAILDDGKYYSSLLEKWGMKNDD